MKLKLRALIGLMAIAAVGAIGTSSAGASTTATQHFMIVQTTLDGPHAVYAAGPISATGSDVVINNHKDHFVFPRGTVIVKHEASSSRESFDPETCVGTFSERGTYTIVRGSDAYRGVSGSGRYKAFGFIQGCDPNEPPTSIAVVVIAQGSLTLG